LSVGFTDGSIPVPAVDGFGGSPNSYGIAQNNSFWLSGKKYQWNDSIRTSGTRETVLGCGILLNSKNKLAVFFTQNGILKGKY
jgi:hypothetical protein